MGASLNPSPHERSEADPLGPPSGELARSTTAGLPARVLLVVIGTIALGVGVAGILVPVLPTTPFVLLAAACYARASTRLYGWLLGQPALGPIITEWRRSRALPPGVRRRALALVTLTFGVSIILVDGALVRAGLAVVGVVLMTFLYRIPTRS